MQNVFYMPSAVGQVYCAVQEYLEQLIATQYKLDERDRDIFQVRFERYFADFYEPLAKLYGHRPDFEEQIYALGEQLLKSFAARSHELKRLDLEREITPDWFQRETMVGGIYYVDQFAGTLEGVRKHKDYLRELELNYIHLMPVLKPREGMNDGGYAVEDYTAIAPELGNMEDLAALATELRAGGMSLCLDLVVNHTAKEHQWAKRAQAGEQEYLDYYFTFDDRTLPDAYERTLPEVFPDFAPGNFTWYPDMQKWVWTTFNEFQWDLNYNNPAVFRGILSYMLFLANQGVDVLRLDAVPFMWKRMGTDCQNQPEVHELLQAFRALMRVVAPGLIFKAEAIVPPYVLVNYLGMGQHTGKECEIAYNNSLMVMLWSSLATRKVALMTYTLQNIPATPIGTTWITYVRCHDDIGWAVTEENAAAIGENAYFHRLFLKNFYAGNFPNSFARGAVFQLNEQTGEGRTSGMTASLVGMEQALSNQDRHELELAIGRIILLYSVIFSYGGLPLIYMGDEVGLLNDYNYVKDPFKANDNRWMHRPPMDWDLAEQRHDPTTPAGRIFQAMLHLIATRKHTRQLHGAATSEALWTDNQHVFAYRRYHPATGRLIAICNFSEWQQTVNVKNLLQGGQWYNVLKPGSPPLEPDIRQQIWLEPYQFMWLVDSR